MPSSPPTSLDPQTLKIKNRIITHMNADHANSLSLFLQHYNSMPEPQTLNPKLIDITPSQLIISTSTSNYNVIIPLKPPMESLSGARERMVQMHKESLAGLGLSEVKISTWVPPTKIWQVALTILASISFVTFPFRSWVTPEVNGVLYNIWSLGGRVPGLAWLCNRLAPYALVFMVVAHGIEMRFMASGRLRRHGVEQGSGVWWAWVANVGLSGVAAMDRFDGLVGEIEKEGERKRSEKGGGGH